MNRSVHSPTTVMFGFALILLTASLSAAPQSAMVMLVSGEVKQVENGKHDIATRLSAFNKLLPGVVLQLGKDAQIQLVYYKNGRKEHWTGPIQIKIGNEGSNTTDKTSSRPIVENLPNGIGQQLSELPESIDMAAIQRGGILVVRGLKTRIPTDLKAQWETYKQLRQQSHKSDCTPDLYWLSVLHQTNRTKLFNQFLKKMLQRFPTMKESLKP